jgi:hypothetical protein
MKTAKKAPDKAPAKATSGKPVKVIDVKAEPPQPSQPSQPSDNPVSLAAKEALTTASIIPIDASKAIVIESSVAQARNIVITDDITRTRAAEFLSGQQSLLKEVTALFDPMTKAIWNAHRVACAQRDKFTKPIDQSIEIIKEKIRLDRVELDIQAQVERDRIVREQRQREALIEKENERLSQDHQARKEKEAELAAERGASDEEIEAILYGGTAAPSIPLTQAPEVIAIPAKLPGVSFRENWEVEVTDKMELLKYIITAPHLVHLVEVDLSALKKYANLVKGEGALPGVRFARVDTVAGRGK